MPTHFLSHEDGRECVCACCGVKTDQLRISDCQERLIKKYAHTDYDSSVMSYPTGLCGTCKTNLYRCAKPGGLKNRQDPKIKWKNFELSKIQVSRFHDDLNCRICSIARSNPIGLKGQKRKRKPKISTNGDKENYPPLKKVIPKKICSREGSKI